MGESKRRSAGGITILNEDNDYCYECAGYGDDYYFNAKTGEWESACDKCPFNEVNDENWTD